jgi:DNA-binding GntR family transcriptional regulator
MAQRYGRTPPSRQIAATIRARIESGELKPGEPLPSIINLSEQYQVATRTIQKALAILKRDGLVESEPGYGTFVAER